jgi:hypothetical protein
MTSPDATIRHATGHGWTTVHIFRNPRAEPPTTVVHFHHAAGELDIAATWQETGSRDAFGTRVPVWKFEGAHVATPARSFETTKPKSLMAYLAGLPVIHREARQESPQEA